MRAWRLSDVPVADDEDDDLKSPEARSKVRATIFLGCTSNLVSAGTRETIRWLLEHKKVDCLVTTAGGIEEDIIKCLAPHYMGDFALKGSELRAKGINRIGNLLVPNRNYCLFEDWFSPILDGMLDEQLAKCGAARMHPLPSLLMTRGACVRCPWACSGRASTGHPAQ